MSYTRVRGATDGRVYVIPDRWAPEGDVTEDGDWVVLRGIGMDDLTTEEYIQVVNSDLESANFHSMIGVLDRILLQIESLGLTEQQLRAIIGAIGDELQNGY